ncbi:MAG: nitroreductase family deazaflavin-dependent oxidoreductase [Proteobacteria bacterium]|nr:nitroreductase family deazaflavin-dependent oxidoreductase [Pseudomonadota bacterium]
MNYEKPLNELVKPDWLSEADWKLTLEKVESADRMRQDSKAHVELYRSTGGKEGYELGGCPCLLLTTIGRKSGNLVTTALNFLKHGESYVLVGSLGGTAEDPHWAKNLKQTPKASVQVKDQKWEADVREVTGEERAQLWPSLVKAMPLWGVFVERTDRPFPIFFLTPKRDA